MRSRVWVALAISLVSCAKAQPAPREPAPSISPTSAMPGASACEGSAIDLLAAIANPSCRISEDEADRLRNALEDASKVPLRVQASALGAGRVEVAITNTGSVQQSLPLLVHSELDTFPTTANGNALAAPEPEWPAGFAFDTGRMLVKIVLPAGGTARARVRINPSIVSRSIHDCPANAKCAPETVQHGELAAGTYTLAIRTPLYSIRSDLEAKLPYTRTR